MKTGKCKKLHKDKKIGLSLCPVSCKIVDECLKSKGVSVVAATTTGGGEGVVTAATVAEVVEEDGSAVGGVGGDGGVLSSPYNVYNDSSVNVDTLEEIDEGNGN